MSWRLVAPRLAKDYTVIVPDLRGYGDSSKPPDGDSHVNYSKRSMALDHPDTVTKLAVLDIIPTYYVRDDERGVRIAHVQTGPNGGIGRLRLDKA